MTQTADLGSSYKSGGAAVNPHSGDMSMIKAGSSLSKTGAQTL